MDDLVLLCEPTQFAYNPDTATSNTFMSQDRFRQDAVLVEFEQLKQQLQHSQIPFAVLPSPGTEATPTPDAVFVNNWFCYLPEGILALFPMKTANRAAERANKENVLAHLAEHHFPVNEILDLSHYEAEQRALESTGSMVFDHQQQRIYAALSERTNRDILDEFARYIGYQPICFHAYDMDDQIVYHTNVVMMILEQHVVICLDAIQSEQERALVKSNLESSGKSILEITLPQMHQFCGNCIDVRAHSVNHLLLSETAWQHFSPEQKKMLEPHYEPIIVSIPTIETVGGGSVRCMVAKISALF